MEKRLTPLREAIQFWNERYKQAKEVGAFKTMEAADLFLQYLQELLPKEQQLLSDTWDAGANHVRENWYGADHRFPNKGTYLSQFKQD